MVGDRGDVQAGSPHRVERVGRVTGPVRQQRVIMQIAKRQSRAGKQPGPASRTRRGSRHGGSDFRRAGDHQSSPWRAIRRQTQRVGPELTVVHERLSGPRDGRAAMGSPGRPGLSAQSTDEYDSMYSFYATQAGEPTAHPNRLQAVPAARPGSSLHSKVADMPGQHVGHPTAPLARVRASSPGPVPRRMARA